MDPRVNIAAGFAGILSGCIVGAIQGLFFHREDWLGGYASWSRRMVRLGHISFFGIGWLNVTVGWLMLFVGEPRWDRVVGVLLLIGAVTMPLVCYLSAADRRFRHLFPIPVLAVITALTLFIVRVLPELWTIE